jgi:16S rRNA G527 N7-methylase RsmG
MLDLIGPLMDDKTQLLAMKGQVPEEEIQQIAERGFQVNLEELKVPEIDGQRHLITIRK